MGKQCSQPCHQAAALTEGKSGSRLASAERSADTEASDWLVVDCQEQVLYLAAQKEARWHLVAQWPRYHSKPLEYTQEELGRLLDNLK